jgi:hypothetical protein
VFGTVVVSVHARGFCFIKPDDAPGRDHNHYGGRRELVDFSDVPAVGTRVQFESQSGERGLFATNIRPVPVSGTLPDHP